MAETKAAHDMNRQATRLMQTTFVLLCSSCRPPVSNSRFRPSTNRSSSLEAPASLMHLGLLDIICYSFSGPVSQPERSLCHPDHIRWKQPQNCLPPGFLEVYWNFALFSLRSPRGWRQGMAKLGKRDYEITLEVDSDRHGGLKNNGELLAGRRPLSL